MKHPLAYKYGYIEGKGWVGVIFEDSPPPKTVLTAGVEDTEPAIIEWCKGSVASMENGGEELPCRTERMRN